MERLLWISLAGAAGTAVRYLTTIALAERFGSALPYGTLAVNLTGCFAIAALVPAGAALGWSPTVRTAVTVGFLGGFTTYSSFNYETMRLWETDASGVAALNVALTVLGGLGAGWLGMVVGRQFVTP
jgi:fluoride exporter